MQTDEHAPQPAGFSYDEVQKIASDAWASWRREQIRIWGSDATTQITTDMARHVLMVAEAVRSSQIYEQPTGDLHNSFDAAVWAHAWMVIQQDNPGMCAEYDTVYGWFANALVTGFDEGCRYANKNAEAKDA